MRIYFAGAICAGRDNVRVYQHIVERLKSLGHAVPSEHVARPGVLDEESRLTPREVFERDMAWLGQADAVIAEVSTPSLGVGFEIATALARRAPTLCLFREDLNISKMITGHPSPHLTIAGYGDLSELDRHIDKFLEQT